MSVQPCCEDHLDAMRDRKDLLAMQLLAPLASTYLPWSMSAMRPSAIVAVLNEIVVGRRRHVVELGSGISTYYVGRLLLARGGHLWTVEHDDQWADLLEEGLARESLTDVVTVVRAPLTPISMGWPGEEATWYDRDIVRNAVAGQLIELLVIDGPPAYQAGRRHSRYPAIPVLAPMLTDDFTIVLDDINRTGEQDIMEAWERQLDIAFECRLVDGTIAIGRSRSGFTV